jgi:hypothetical protein
VVDEMEPLVPLSVVVHQHSPSKVLESRGLLLVQGRDVQVQAQREPQDRDIHRTYSESMAGGEEGAKARAHRSASVHSHRAAGTRVFD